MNPQWIFFDIGSTLVNETKAYNHRAKEMLSHTNISFEEFDIKRTEFAIQGLDGNSQAIKFFDLEKTPWHCEDEELFPFTASTLNYLKEKGYKLGIIANQVSGTTDRLKEWNLLCYFDVIASSDILGVAKPDKAIFEKALIMANCKAQNAIMVGDRMDNDILPAKQLGMKTIWIQGKYINLIPNDMKCKADYVLSTIEELKSIF